MREAYHARISSAAKNGGFINLSTGLLERMNPEAHVDELQNDLPDCLDIFELLLMREIGLIEEVRELLRVELNGKAVLLFLRWTSFMGGRFGIGHGGYLSL